MIEILTIKEAKKFGVNKRVVDFKEFSREIKKYTSKFSLEGLKVLFSYLNSGPDGEDEVITCYSYWSQHYEESTFEEFVKTVKFRIFCDECKPTKEAIAMAFFDKQINEDYCYLVGLTDTSVVYSTFK